MTAPLRTIDPIIVDVVLGERSYDIVIGRGLLASLGQRIAALRPGAKAAIVTDETVASHYLAATEAALGAAGIAASCVTVPPGESSKSFAVLERVCEALISARIERGDLIVALGGGVVGDLAGFAAAVVRRGLDYVQVPTTLAGAGRLLGRRQDRDRFPARQEPGRSISPAGPGRRRHGAARYPCRRGNSAPAMPRWQNTG